MISLASNSITATSVEVVLFDQDGTPIQKYRDNQPFTFANGDTLTLKMTLTVDWGPTPWEYEIE